MAIRLVEVSDHDDAALVDFLTGSEWPFHTRARWTADQVQEAFADRRFAGPGVRSFWLEDTGGHGRVGLATVTDLDDPTAEFDLRLEASYRGQGFGTAALAALIAEVFARHPAVRRFEGQTRADNTAMRRAFRRAGFVKEAHYRQGWPVGDGTWLDSVAYAMLRDDWAGGRSTPVDWDDEPARP